MFPTCSPQELTRTQIRLECELRTAERLLFAVVLVAVGYIAVVGFLVFG